MVPRLSSTQSELPRWPTNLAWCIGLSNDTELHEGVPTLLDDGTSCVLEYTYLEPLVATPVASGLRSLTSCS
jgi:hypothetical protein